jgi:dihydrofolate synthase/folylpolyglutamate synthase
MGSEPVDWLYDLQHSGIKLGLDNIRALLDLLDHPEHRYPAVLVAGTNGKGSVAAMLESMLRAHGIRVGMFTSPHLMRPNERIRINGEDIADAELDRVLIAMRTRIDSAIESGQLSVHPSFFETLTATALQAFNDADIECAVLEIGMGGRLDATNAVDATMSVIVTIDYDHVDRLGGSLESIAGEKAAIVKPGKPLVSGAEQDQVREVLQRHADEVGAAVFEARRLADVQHLDHHRFSVRTQQRFYDDLTLPLRGRHQRDNARVAVVALETLATQLDFDVETTTVRSGLAQTRWPGRLQWIEGRPPLLLDGAHNPAGARALAEYLRTEMRGREPILLFSTMKKKQVEKIVQPLSDLIAGVIITKAGVERAAEPEDLARVIRPLVKRVEVIPDPGQALERARFQALPDDYVLVAGSLYLIGEVLGFFDDRAVPGPVSM